jgi:hypothetical protein
MTGEADTTHYVDFKKFLPGFVIFVKKTDRFIDTEIVPYSSSNLIPAS